MSDEKRSLWKNWRGYVPALVVAVLVGSSVGAGLMGGIVGFGGGEYKKAEADADAALILALVKVEIEKAEERIYEAFRDQRVQIEEANDRQTARVEELMEQNLDVTDGRLDDLASRDTLWLKTLVIADDDNIARMSLSIEHGEFPSLTFYGEGGLGNSSLYGDDTGNALVLQTGGNTFVCMMNRRFGSCGIENGYLEFLD